MNNSIHPLSVNWKSLELECFGFTHPLLVGRYTRHQMESIIAATKS